MNLLEKVYSKRDNTIKYIFFTDDKLIIELAYINKDDGKDIICVPSQTACKMKCKFCHITDFANILVNRNLSYKEIKNGIDYIYEDLKLGDSNRILLISYMGCGEPLLNYVEVIKSMVAIRDFYQDNFKLVRFGLATSLPKFAWNNFFKLAKEIEKEKLLVKIHLSLHYTEDKQRKLSMEKSLEILPSIIALEYYKVFTGNSVEIHYALIDDLNDRDIDALLLTNLLRGRNIPVKFLFYNEKPTIKFHASSKEKIEVFAKYFNKYGIEFEYYIPPGLDIGTSCGQFLTNYYEKYNIKLTKKEI